MVKENENKELDRYTKIEEVYIATSGTGEGWYSSGEMKVNLDTSKYYYIGTSWEGSVIYGRGTESVPLPTSFGTLETGIAGTLAGFPPSATISQGYSNYPPYYQTIVTGKEVDWVNLNLLSDTIPAGDSTKIEVTFDATDLNGGNYFADIIIASNDPDESEVTVPAHLNVTGVPDITISADTMDLGIVYTGYSSTDTLIVSNEGTDSLNVSDISSDNPDYTVDTTNFSLYPGETQEVVVTFTPSSVGIITGNLTISSDDPDESTISVFLQAEGLEPPDISVSPDSLSDSLFTGEISVDTLTIYNTGNSDLIFEIATEDVDGGGLKLSAKKIPIVPTNIGFNADNRIQLSCPGFDSNPADNMVHRESSPVWQAVLSALQTGKDMLPCQRFLWKEKQVI